MKLSGSHLTFYQQLLNVVPESQLITDPFKTLVYSTDASFYRLQPKFIVVVEDEAQIQSVLRIAYDLNVPVCFRAAGTSLSGQAITDSVLIKLSDNWQHLEVLDNGQSIKMQCGVLGSQANAALAKYSSILGPMPASIDAASVGGMAINNAAGMNSLDTYGQMTDAKFIFANGNELDTKLVKSNEQSRIDFLQQNKILVNGITELVSYVKSNPILVNTIKQKYRIKNTTGYNLRALVEFDDIVDVISHLMIGSEGTLGFISHITHKTVAVSPFKSVSLIVLNSLADAGIAVQRLKSIQTKQQALIGAAELIDYLALKAICNEPGMPKSLQTLTCDSVALLVQVEANGFDQLMQSVHLVSEQLANLDLASPIQFSQDKLQIQQYWQMRKAIFPAVGANRPAGTTALIEDVAFPIERLPEALVDLHSLLTRYEYSDAVIYGHALDGNLHFIFSQAFATQQQIDRYEAFMRDVVNLVVDKYQGSLKAEHGTGRNMAPFVEQEWGPLLYDVMKRIKSLFDDRGILNPDVMITKDQRLFIKNIKPLIAGNELIDKCIECGFCERQCPSKNITFTPRQRIVGQREIMAQEHNLMSVADKTVRLKNLQSTKKTYEYQGIDTCAGCGLCETSCPVGINTGDLIRQQRRLQHQSSPTRNITTNALATLMANQFGFITNVARLGIAMNSLLKKSTTLSRWLSLPTLPSVEKLSNITNTVKMANGQHSSISKKVVLFPSCISRVFGATKPEQLNKESEKQSQSQTEAFVSILNKAGYEVVIPKNVDQQCCGLPFKSKGFPNQATEKTAQLIKELTSASDQGRWPIVMDTSQCFEQLLEGFHKSEHSQSGENLALNKPEFDISDPLSFLHDNVLPKLKIVPKTKPVTFHLTCAARRGQKDALALAILKSCAENVTIPADITCCGFAGDKGFSVPELNASALKALKPQVSHCHSGYSTSRTCEIGLTTHSGILYQSIVYLMDEVSE
ncbi:FAD-binding and (Fe-S)-binding domain-containing protein [Psychrosphaera aestuarii]